MASLAPSQIRCGVTVCMPGGMGWVLGVDMRSPGMTGFAPRTLGQFPLRQRCGIFAGYERYLERSIPTGCTAAQPNREAAHAAQAVPEFQRTSPARRARRRL